MSCLKVNKLTSLHYDPDCQKYDTVQSMSEADYIFRTTNNTNKDFEKVATCQPNINYKNGYDRNINNIETESRMGYQQVFKGDDNQLFSRPFLTIPYIGRGEVKTDVESDIKSPRFSNHNNLCDNVSEKFFDNQFIPLVDNLKRNIQNPINIIQEDNKLDWFRGGLDTSQARKDIEYFNKCIDPSNVKETLKEKKQHLHKNMHTHNLDNLIN